MTGIEGFITKKPLQSIEYRGFKVCLVPVAGLEPALPKKPDFESSVSTNSTTLAFSAQFHAGRDYSSDQ